MTSAFRYTPLEYQTFNILPRAFMKTENNLLIEICATKTAINNRDTRTRNEPSDIVVRSETSRLIQIAQKSA
jgi:hypothetical protein